MQDWRKHRDPKRVIEEIREHEHEMEIPMKYGIILLYEVNSGFKRQFDKFVDLSGDDNKLHVDKEFAEKTSFKKPVVHGMLGASFILSLYIM